MLNVKEQFETVEKLTIALEYEKQILCNQLNFITNSQDWDCDFVSDLDYTPEEGREEVIKTTALGDGYIYRLVIYYDNIEGPTTCIQRIRMKGD